MKDAFMLELFSAEARKQCALLEAMCGGSASPKDGERAANALKGAARMLGFALLADVCEKLEDFLHRVESHPKFNSGVIFAVSVLSECAKAEPSATEKAVSESAEKFSEILKTGFSAEDASSSSEVSPESPAGDSLPKIDPAMKPLFLEETRNQLAVITDTLVELEDDFSNAKKIEVLMRASHSLKGAARVVGLDDIVAFTHEMENCFVAAQNSKILIDSDSLDVFFECVDFVSGLCESGFETMNRSKFAELSEKLSAVENARPLSGLAKKAEAEKSAEEPRGRNARDSFVKVSAKSLNSLMELAAESLIENRRIELYREAASSVKKSQEQIVRQLESAMNSLEGTVGADPAMARLEQLRRSMYALIDDSRAQIDGLGEYSRRNVILSDKLYNEVLASRMRPLSDGITGFPRMVRDLAREAQKKISLEIHGKDVPVDRDVLEKLEAPITHLLRNACDHGIEYPDERESVGKPRSGRIRLSAWHSAGFLMLKITDDGRGLDEPKIRRKIIEKNLVSEELFSKMSADEVFEFLFLPGFTTKDAVTQLSGRGVGLDVVRSMLRDVGGTISVSTRRGRGASFTMKLPITRSVMKTLTVGIGGEPYAIPLGRIYRTLKLSPSEISAEDGRRVFVMDSKKIRLLPGVEVLGLGRASPKIADETFAVVISDKGNFYGFEVDGLPNESELVVRPLHARLGKIPCVSAASLNEDGLPVLIIDADDLVAYADRFSERGAAQVVPDSSGVLENSRKILVVDDSSTVRETQKKLLAGAGFSVDTAVDGVDGWNSFRLSKYDLVVSDIDMPRMTGFELVEKIRKVNSKVPIVIVSYKDRSEDRKRALKAGVNAYLTKSSFQDDSFLKTVRELLK